MKRLVILILVGAILLTGCWDKREINQLAFVQGLGIEKGKDDMIHLIVQILKPGLLATGGGGAGGTGGRKCCWQALCCFSSQWGGFCKGFF